MSLKKKLAKGLLYGVLTVGALCGVPMSPADIEKLLKLGERGITRVVAEKKSPKRRA